MMLRRGFIAVVKMQLLQLMLSRAFVFSTLLMPLIMFGVIFIQARLADVDGVEPSHLFITSDDQALLDSLAPRFAAMDAVRSGTYTLEYQQVVGATLDAYLASKRPTILANSNNGLFYIPVAAVGDKAVSFYSTNVGNQALRQSIGGVINETLNREHFAKVAVAESDLAYAVKALAIGGFTVTEDGEAASSLGNVVVGFVMCILLLLSMMGIVMPFSAAIIEEKSNRAVEVLLTSVSPQELLAGKIVARAITGVAQMLVWLVPLFVFLLAPALLVLPPEFSIDISAGTLLFFLVNYVLGLVTLLAVWGGFSAMFDSTQDAGQAMWPVTLLMWLPFYAVFAVMRNPANSVATILSMTPFTSLYVMPLRLVLIEVSWWQPLLALAANGAVVAAAIWAGGKIYRISILATGQQPTMQQFFHWLKTA